jgi:hypothetical protein
MRTFHSYGPVNCKQHFCVPRKVLIEQAIKQLIGVPNEGGHYFTIWAPRQTGKTWLMRQIKSEIGRQDADGFTLFDFSLGGLRGMSFSPSEDSNFPAVLGGLLQEALPGKPLVSDWKDFRQLFSREKSKSVNPSASCRPISDFICLINHVLPVWRGAQMVK